MKNILNRLKESVSESISILDFNCNVTALSFYEKALHVTRPFGKMGIKILSNCAKHYLRLAVALSVLSRKTDDEEEAKKYICLRDQCMELYDKITDIFERIANS